jgi:putative transposase
LYKDVITVNNFFDPNFNFEVYRRNLHRRQAGVTYFVTFHLADSLPTKKLTALAEERKLWLSLNPPPLSKFQVAEYDRNFSERIINGSTPAAALVS